MYKHILMPTDGSELSKAAVRQGVQLAKEGGAKVTFLNVVTPFHVFAANTEMVSDTRKEYEKHSRQHAERILAECEQVARGAGVSSDGRFAVNEHPYEEIVKAGEEADLIVMASHGRKGVKGLLLGSETHKTITHGHTPVLVVR
jgi:nucleotide-binding universal stress UspA family protein